MGFGDLKKSAGLETLDAYLADKSYIEGFQPSQADTVVFNALSGAPASNYVNALRWFNHINSYGAARSTFPGQKKDLSAYGPAGSGPAAPAGGDDDDDFDLFGSDDDNEEAEALKQKRLEEYAAKKAKKPGVVAKSSLLLDVKPWDDETDMKVLEECVRTIEMDGLLWGASKLVPVGYGIKKLQISCVIEDEKVSTDVLEEKITEFEDHVQSMDIAAFNKI